MKQQYLLAVDNDQATDFDTAAVWADIVSAASARPVEEHRWQEDSES